MGFGAAFVTEFTVENRTDVAIVVTPVGTVGSPGAKSPLPVKLLAVFPLPALRCGGYRLAPGASVTIKYDMDDINFSEIVVETPGRTLQLVTDPNPTSRQYHGPLKRHYEIDDLSQLAEVSLPVQAAGQAANRQLRVALIEYSLLIGPWLVYGSMALLSGHWERRKRLHQTLQ